MVESSSQRSLPTERTRGVQKRETIEEMIRPGNKELSRWTVSDIRGQRGRLAHVGTSDGSSEDLLPSPAPFPESCPEAEVEVKPATSLRQGDSLSFQPTSKVRVERIHRFLFSSIHILFLLHHHGPTQAHHQPHQQAGHPTSI